MKDVMNVNAAGQLPEGVNLSKCITQDNTLKEFK